MITKKFEYKGQMINYYNKMRNNSNIDFWYRGFSCEEGCYVIAYCYKNK